MSYRPGLMLPATLTTIGLTKPDGITITVDSAGVETVVGASVGSCTDAGTLLSSDVLGIYRGSTDLKTTGPSLATLIHKLPAGSRTASLPAVLTSADNDKSIVLTGTTGNLSTDGTLPAGAAVRVINTASGNATLSGITGSPAGTNTLVPGAVGLVIADGTTVWCSTNGVTANATHVTPSPSTLTGVNNAPQTLTFTFDGASVAGQSIGLALTAVAGTFGGATNGAISGSGSSWTFTPTVGATTASVQFTPTNSTSGSIALTGTSIIVNAPTSITVTVTTAAATHFATSPLSFSVASGTPQTLSFTPDGNWQAGQAITLNLVTVAGAFATAANGTIAGSGSSWTFTPTSGNGTASTVQFTPSSANGTTGSITVGGTSITSTNTSISVTVSASLPALPTVTMATTAIYAPARDSSSVTITSTKVTGLADLSGNANNLTALSSNPCTVSGTTLNGRTGALSFSAVGSSLKQTASPVATAMRTSHMGLLVTSGQSASNGNAMGGSDGTGTNYLMACSFATQAKIQRTQGGSNAQSLSAVVTSGALQKIVWRHNFSTGLIEIWMNGVLGTSPQSQTSAALFTELCLGAHWAGAATGYVGLMWEVHIYSGLGTGDATSGDVKALIDYATAMYG